MKITKYIFALVIALCCAVGNLFAVEKSYYNSLDGKSGTALREALTTLLYTKHTTNVGYNWTFDGIDVVNGEVQDIYSTCTWTSSQQGKDYSGVCDAYNREHLVPQSAFNEATPQKTDRHHLFLADGKVNGMRSSYPFGETNVTNAFSSLSNGNKALGKLGASSNGYSGTVYEPDDEYKGDIARAVMYMVVRYATNNVCREYNGSSNSKPVTTWDNAMFSGSLSTNYGLSANAVAIFMKWHKADPVSDKEIARNNGVEAKQGNRNPFVDLPDLAEYLWGDHKTDAVDLNSLTIATGGGAVATPYEITLNRNGATQTLTCTGTYTLPTALDESDACEGWPFVGWTTSSSYNSTTAPTYTTSVSSATTLYAVYANTSAASAPKRSKAESTAHYEKVMSDGDLVLGEYLIVCENSSVAFDGSLHTLDANNNNIDVSIEGKTIAANSTTEAYEFVIDPDPEVGSIRSKSGYYIGATSNSNSLNTSISTAYTNEISIDNSGNAVIQGSGGAYLRFNNNTSNLRFRYFKSSTYSSQQTIQLYRKTTSESSTTTYMTSPTCGDPHTITLSDGGTVTGGEFEASASSAYAGATITLMAEASAGYTFGSWTVTNISTSATITVTDNQFTMPDANVTVSATFNALPTYNIRFFNNGSQIGTTQSVYSGGYPDIPSNPTDCEDYTFVGWYTSTLSTDNTTSHAWVEDFTVSGAQDYYAVYEHTETSGGGSSTTVTDELTRATTGVTTGSTTYSNWSGKNGTSGAIYAGNSAGGNDAIQLRSNNSNSGIITTNSGGKATKVIVAWQSNTQEGRTIDIYGKNSAYSAASDLYGSNAGTLIGSIAKGTTELTISDEYEYIGIRSNSGALYLTSVSITWSSGGGGSSTTYYTSTTDCTAPCSGNLDKPTVTATPGDGKITLTWPDVTGADHYTVTIGQGVGYTTECGSATSIGTITNSAGTNTCVITGLTNGLEYTTSVVANGTIICDSPADEDQATPLDCNPWADPTLTYNSYALTVGSAHATLTIDGTQHGTPTFSSSNVSVLTVDADGEVTPVGAGTATITAHWEMTNDYCEKDVVSSPFTVSGPLTITFNANDGTDEPATKTQTVTYNVAATLDANTFTRTGYVFQGWATTADGAKVHNDGASVTFTESTVLYAVWQINSHNVTFTPSITGATVTVNSQSTSPQSAEYGSTVTVSVSPAAHYTLYSIEVSNGASVTIKNNTGTFTMPDEDVTVTVTMTEEAKATVNWYVNGTPTAEEKYAGETLAGITDPTSSDCDGAKVFMGWTEEPIYFNETTAPGDLFTNPTTKTMPAGGTNYYAVFADEGTGSGATVTLLSEDFASITTGNSTSTSGSSSSWSGNSNIEFISYAYQAGGAVRIGSGSYSGSIETKTLEATAGTEITVTFDVKGWSSVEGDIRVTVTGCDPQEIEYTAVMGGVFETKSAVFTLTSDNPTVTIATTDKRAFIDNLIVTAGGGTTYSNYSTSCVTYEVTAVSNNDAWGTVSVDGYKVTATPAEGYIADGYTITVGTATATQNGNIYSVVPTSDCTIRINFRAATPYTVTFYDNNTSYNQTAYELTPFILPEDGLSSCPDATFLGWVEGTYIDHATGTTTEPTYISPGAEVTLTEATTYTAVYGTIVNNVSTEYRQLTSFAEYKDGDYLVVAHYSDNLHYAMSNTILSGHVDEENVGNGTTITSDQEKLIWTITKVGSYYTLYNAAANKYLALSASAPLIQDEAHNFSMAFSSGFVFESVTETESQLAYEYNFISQTSQSKPIYLYKRIPTIGSYTSHPECCYEPTEKLVIASDVETLIGSGVAHLTLSGGNGKDVTWSTTGGTLSDETNTSATLTLPAAGSYIVTAVQADDETNPEHVICGAEVSLTITVKSQWTITYKTIEESVEYTYNTAVVTDGDSYTLPDISEEFTCPENISFAGWASSSSATAVEAAAGTAQTATADATWYAVWRSGSGVKKETRTKYELISDVSSLNVNDVIVLAYNSVGMSTLDGTYFGTVEGLMAEDGSYITFAPEAVVQELTLKEGPEDTWYLYLEGQYMAFGNKIVSLQASAPSTGLSISISDNAAVISDGTYRLQYNSSNPRFTAYSSSQKIPSIYRKNGTVEVEVSADVDYTTNNTCLSGAVIRANTEQWITASKGQKVKRVYEVKALNFDEPSTLTIQSNTDSHFTATLAETAIPATPGRLETTLTVEYLPTEDNTANSTTITLRAGETTKTLEVNGRSLPGEFLIITKKTVWYALPANMNGGEKQYEGVTVTPDDGAEPSSVAVAPSTIVYSLRSVADSRYADNGTCVRLAGNGNKALWGNITADATTIQNNEIIGSTNGANYEWLLNTTDGIHYSIGNPNHADFEAGRVLAFGDKFGQYKSPTVFYLVPTGCNSQPQDVSVSARRVDATFSWLSNASSMAIDVYTNEEMTVLATSVTATSVPYYMTGLSETTDYWFRLTPDGEDACSVTGSFKTTGPTVDIVEWETDGVVIFVDKDETLNPYVVIEGEVEHGVGTAYNATELFFSKYFEGSGDMKLVAIFNGTPDDISLDDYRLYTKNCSAPKNEGAIASSAFTSTTEYPISALGIIKSGQEIVFFTRPTASTQASLSECSEAFLNEMAAKSGADEMPRWIECNNSTLYNGQKFPAMQFNGNDAICLEKNDALIDVIGSTGDPGKVKNCANRLNDLGWSISVKNIDYGKTSDDPAFDNLYEASSKEPITDDERRAILGGFNINLDDETIDLTTARCILFRDKSVTSGERAVALNTDADFATCAPFTYEAVDYPSEWNGRAVCMTTAMQTAAGVTDDSRATCNSYQDLGEFDYNDYYKEWTSIDGKTLDEYTYHEDTKTYDIPIENLSKYTCLNIRFQLKNDAGEVVTESPVQVPIIVTGGHTTIDEIFNAIVKTDSGDPLHDQSIDRCKTCNVVVLSDGVLTKASGSDPNDAIEVGNVKVYPGGQLIVPTGTEYTVNSLAFRRQEDEIATANIQGTLNIKETGNNVFLDVRIDPTNWHYISLPYDCNVSDIRFADDEIKKPILGTDYLLKWYDGEKRAATQTGGCWEMVKPDGVLKKGLGYIFALPGDGKVKREFRFPMANEVINEEKSDKTISGVYGYGGNLSDQELRPNHKGWNLVGAPYLMNYTSDITDPLRTGLLIQDPVDPKYWIIDESTTALRYIVEPVDNGWSEYRQVAIADYQMKPFTCYFVQIGGNDPTAIQGIEFNADKVERSSIVRRARSEYAETDDTHPVWCVVNITNPKGEKDETTMLISNDFTDGYDMMNDLVKMRGDYYQYAQVTTKPVLASRNNEGEMAFNALPDASAEMGVPLNFFSAYSGSYTMAYNDKFDRDNEVKAVMLHDKQTNEWYDLMNEPYTFYSIRTDDTERFVLIVRVDRKKEPQITTDTEIYPSSNERPQKILRNQHIYILRGGRVYDITGKQMLNR